MENFKILCFFYKNEQLLFFENMIFERKEKIKNNEQEINLENKDQNKKKRTEKKEKTKCKKNLLEPS